MPTAKEPPLRGSPDQIVPRIKHRNFLAAAADRIPDAAQRPVWRAFIADMILTYAYDTPEMFLTLSQKEADGLGMARDDLFKLAIANFQKSLPEVKRGGKPPLVTFHIGKHQEACLLLLKGFWNGFASQVPGRPVVSMATRDVLLVTTDQSSLGLGSIRQIAAEARQRDPVHTISEALLCWDQGKWLVFDGPIVGA